MLLGREVGSLFRRGSSAEVPVIEAYNLHALNRDRPRTVNWFDVPDPNSPDLDELARRFHLHELQIEDCRHRPQRAKVDEYGTYMFAVLKHLVPKGQEPEFDDFDVFLGRECRPLSASRQRYGGGPQGDARTRAGLRISPAVLC